MPKIVTQPFEDGQRLGDYLNANLSNREWDEFTAAVAFVKQSGVKYIAQSLAVFCQHGTSHLYVGVDLAGTSVEGVTTLFGILKEKGRIYVIHNYNGPTFHPKLYLFKNKDRALCIVGSGNLTRGGLYTNYEAAIALSLDFSVAEDLDVLESVETSIRQWADPDSGTMKVLDEEVIKHLIDEGLLVPEAMTVQKNVKRTVGVSEPKEAFFLGRSVPMPPATPPELPEIDEDNFIEPVIEEAPAQEGEYLGFLMTLQKTDVGVGQTHTGTARRSPEIFVPLSARDYAPGFWGWPDKFDEAEREGMFDRKEVLMRIGGDIIPINMWTWPVKSDFRLRSERLRSAGNIGDILKIERSDGSEGFTYYVEIIPKGSSSFDRYAKLCTHAVRKPSKKIWGYY